MAAAPCSLCEVLCKSDKRRNISSKASETVRNVIKELLQKSGAEVFTEEFLKNNKFVCLKCYGLFEKLLRLRGDIHQHEAMLVTKVKEAYDKAILTHPGEKRPSLEATPIASPPPKRARTSASTPARKIAKMPCNSPSVAVR